MNYMQKPYNLSKIVGYTRCSIKFIAKILITIIIGIIPLLIFLNPLWNMIDTSDSGLAIIRWICSNCAFFFATFLIVYVAPIIGEKLGLEVYRHPSNFG